MLRTEHTFLMQETVGLLSVAEYGPCGVQKHDEWAAYEDSLFC